MKEAANNFHLVLEKALKILIDQKGAPFVEQKFSFIVHSFIKTANLGMPSVDLYSQIFPNLVPSMKGIEKVFLNANEKTETFVPLFHSSEVLYRSWIFNFNTCLLISTYPSVQVHSKVTA